MVLSWLAVSKEIRLDVECIVKTEMEKYLIGMRVYLKSHFDSQDLRLIDVIFY